MTSKINWKKINLIPAIIQDSDTNQVLMLGYMNKESLKLTRKTKTVWFFSRSKNRLWQKGETSNNKLNVTSILSDCDNDTLLIKARPSGPTCHTGSYSCFNEEKKTNPITELFYTIEDRKINLPKDSYTTSLFLGGTNKIIGKVMEETTEVIKASIFETKKRLTEEAVDLIYHFFVLLVDKNIRFNDIIEEIRKRKK